ncbi:MAG: RagB/SusD family nutrient uptake outer membrane protein [Candidatus Nephrothrix sp. EaCA]|nr:MAG: RagB/SusD family nutrient uptake outer membrane protein [Candidatus Nephrothrix sp. EaCA]
MTSGLMNNSNPKILINNQMKKLFRFLPFALLMLCGCGENYLNLNPEVSQGAGNFYKTKTQFVQAVSGAYAPLQALCTGSFWVLAEMRSDNTSYQYNLVDRSGFPLEEIDEFREISSNVHITNFFNASYLGISRANVILDRIGELSAEAASKEQIIGEASFLRAFYYFNLVRFFGDVPLILKEVKSAEESFLLAARKSAAETYAQVLEDAKTAARKLPESYAAAADKGRVTQGTAKTLLAKIYMTQHNFAAAATELRSVVQSNKYRLLNNYADNFSVSKKNGAESVFEIQFMEGTNGESSNFIYTFAPYNSGKSVAALGVAGGSSAGWNIPTQDMLDAYEPGDARKNASVGFDFADPDGRTVPYIKKYQSPHNVRFQTANNFPVYRYSDVLLMLAECLNEAGFVADGEAFSLLNQVRKRAGLPHKTSSDSEASLRVSSQEDFRKAIAKERQVELAFENHRWFDLLRTNKMNEVMAPHAAREKETKKNHVISASYQDLKTVYQYPQREQMLLK